MAGLCMGAGILLGTVFPGAECHPVTHAGTSPRRALFLWGLDRFHLLLAEFLASLQGPVADPFLEDFQVRCTLGVRASQSRVHVARLPVLGALSVVQPSH